MKSTQEENYFKVLTEQGSGNRVADQRVSLGYADNDDSRIAFTVQKCPPSDIYWVKPWDGKPESCNTHKVQMSKTKVDGWLKTRIFNAGMKREDQKWQRVPTPHFWEQETLYEQSLKFTKIWGRSRKKLPDENFWRDPNNLTEEQHQYALLEWHRRIYGIWIMINNRLTWISGFHYFYLQHFQIDTGYPKYRDRDRRWYYAWQACVDDPFCLGMVYLKHRRDGATYRSSAIGLEIVTRGDERGKHYGITSKGEDDAKEVFESKVTFPFDSLITFFKPRLASDKTSTKTELIFNDPPTTGVDQFRVKKIGLQAWIKYAAKSKKGEAPFDGRKLHFSLNDEAGKRKEESISELLRLLRPAMRIDGRLGKMLWPSTNEELDGDNREEFLGMWDDSDPALRLKSSMGTTTTKMLRYFTPAYDGFEEQWFGPFGESIVHAPTQEQREYLLTQGFAFYEQFWDKGWGGYEWCVAQRNEAKDPVGEKRQIPFTPEESFAESNPQSDFNMVRMNRCMDDLMESIKAGSTLIEDITITGKLDWEGEIFKSNVYFREDPKGPFTWNRNYLPVYVNRDGKTILNHGPGWGGELAQRLRIFANNVHRDPPRQGYPEAHGCVRPRGDDSWIVIGMDPQKIDKADQRAKRISKAASHGFYPYNPMVDGPWTAQMESQDPDFAAGWESHAFIFEYLHHPKRSRLHHEDMLKAAIFLNAKILYERQVNDFGNWMREVGCGAFLIGDRAWAKDKTKSIPGIHSDQSIIDLYVKRLESWIDRHCYARRCPFPATIRQWIGFNAKEIEKYDAVVSSGLSLLASQPGELRRDEKFGNLQPQPAVTFNLGTCYPTTRRK